MTTPTYNGRPMKKIKEYSHHVLFIDEKTKVRESFLYRDLIEDNPIIHQVYKEQFSVRNDNRLMEIINKLNGKKGNKDDASNESYIKNNNDII